MIVLLEKLCEFIKKETLGYCCPDYDDEDARPVGVYVQELPQKDSSVSQYSPFILCRLDGGEDTADGAIVRVRIIIGTSDKDKYSSWRTLMNLLNYVRQALLKNPILTMRVKANTQSDTRNREIEVRSRKFYHAKMRLPVKYEIEGPQPWPLGYGFIDTTWDIVRPAEEDILNDF